MKFLFPALLVLSIVLYVIIKKEYFLTPSPALLVASVMALLDASRSTLWITFCALLAICAIAMSLLCLRKPKDADFRSVVGSRCRVTVEVDNYAGRGQVRVGGQIWAARAVSDEEIYEVGDTLSIVAIEGVKLVCRK